MKASITAFFSGLLFAVGLGIAGMTRPIKVIGFLDFFGNWDASLAFVMIGAIGVYFFAYRRVDKMKAPILVPSFSLPKRSDLDASLIGGAALFGIGWGLGGFCPGPALTSLATGAAPVLVFAAAMIAGMYLYSWVTALKSSASSVDWRVAPSSTIQDA